jgi:nucleoside-diphosphate-sugar epimerase
MKRALIGYTGFVGSNLAAQSKFDFLYNSSNIESIRGEEFDEVYCAGVSAVKWKANQDPEADWKGIQSLLDNLAQVKAKKFILISTVDVYKIPIGVDEDTIIDPEVCEPYGKHRFLVEEFIKEHFENTYIIRLPGLFGNGLKKNVIYDFLNNNMLEAINPKGEFQFYSLGTLTEDIQKVIDNNISLINFATPSISVAEVAKEAFGMDFKNDIDKPGAKYDVHTKYAGLFGLEGNYIQTRERVLRDMKDFVDSEKAAK